MKELDTRKAKRARPCEGGTARSTVQPAGRGAGRGEQQRETREGTQRLRKGQGNGGMGAKPDAVADKARIRTGTLAHARLQHGPTAPLQLPCFVGEAEVTGAAAGDQSSWEEEDVLGAAERIMSRTAEVTGGFWQCGPDLLSDLSMMRAAVEAEALGGAGRGGPGPGGAVLQPVMGAGGAGTAEEESPVRGEKAAWASGCPEWAC